MIELLNIMWTLRESQDELVSGPGVTAMIRAFHDMRSRGNPAEAKNDFGFNHGDWQAYGNISAHFDLSSGALPLKVVNRILEILGHYKNRQLQGVYEGIYRATIADITRSHGHVEVGEKAIVFSNEKLYDKVKVYIPGGLNRSQVIRWNKIFIPYLKKKGFVEKYNDKFGGEDFKYVDWKFFEKDRKGNLNTWWVHPELLPDLIKLLEGDKIPVEIRGALPTATTTTASDQPNAPQVAGQRLPTQADIEGKPKLHVVDPQLKTTAHGRHLVVNFKLDFNVSVALNDKLKESNFWRKAISWLQKDGKGGSDYAINVDYFNNEKFLSILEEDLDISSLRKLIAENGAALKAEVEKSRLNGKEVIEFVDEPKAALKVKINYRAIDNHEKKILKEIVTFVFSNALWNQSDYSWNVSGDYNQYVKFGKLLKSHGYNVDQFREVFKAKLNRGDIEKDKLDGDIPENFVDSVQDMLPNSEYEYYDEQKEGVGFLYGNRSAVLGDSTGLGKTIQLIGAAEIKMMEHDYNFKTLFFTINEQLVQQCVEEIVGVAGEAAMSEISTDIMNPKRWTVVKYSRFSPSGKNPEKTHAKIDEIVKKVRETDYGIVIFDELHKLKHEDSARSQNVEKATKNIKIRWGASATISANKPMDVRNQLRLLNHHLGQMDEKRFKREFAGGRKSTQEQKIAAAENLNKWLNLSGVYIRRNKDEVRKMPKLTVGSKLTDVDMGAYHHRANERIKRLKDPELPISVLGAHRLELAVAKVPDTVRMTMDLVKKGERVIVFTNFIDAARELHAQLKDQLLSFGGKLLTYTSDTKARERKKVKKLFTEDKSYKVLLMSLKMGGTGIDFPNAARHMVINDYDWTPESAEQSEGRIYRINTEHPVQIHYVIARNTLDESLFAMVSQKRKIAAIIQQYRKEYHQERNQQKADEDLKKIIDAQKKMDAIEQKMKNAAMQDIEDAKHEWTYLDIFDYVIED